MGKLFSSFGRLSMYMNEALETSIRIIYAEVYNVNPWNI